MTGIYLAFLPGGHSSLCVHYDISNHDLLCSLSADLIARTMWIQARTGELPSRFCHNSMFYYYPDRMNEGTVVALAVDPWESTHDC
jgi:hypothetical protein